MPDPDQMLFRANLKQLRLPTVAREFETLVRVLSRLGYAQTGRRAATSA